MKPRVILVGADKGGVGKTTVASALLDFLTHANQGAVTRAFDTEPEPGRLKARYPNQTEVVDFTNTVGQMRVLDTLRTTPITVIDMKAGILSDTLELLENIGFLDKAQSGEIGLTMLHVLGGTTASFGEIKGVAQKMACGRHYLVKNHINDNSFFQWHPDMAKVLDGGVINIPKINAMAMENIDVAQAGFKAFADDVTQSETLRGYTRYWLKKVYEAFEAAKLNPLP
jgi:hypothetical protein